MRFFIYVCEKIAVRNIIACKWKTHMLKNILAWNFSYVPANGPCTLLIFEFGMFPNGTSWEPNTRHCAKSQSPGTRKPLR